MEGADELEVVFGDQRGNGDWGESGGRYGVGLGFERDVYCFLDDLKGDRCENGRFANLINGCLVVSVCNLTV